MARRKRWGSSGILIFPFALLICFNIFNFSLAELIDNLLTSESTTKAFIISHHLISHQDNGNIPVNIQLKPARYLHGKNYVSTKQELTAKAEILDEKFKNLSITYQWSIKNETDTTNASEIVYHFDKPENNFIKVLVLHRPNDTGTSQKDLVVRDPVEVANPTGKLFLEHGELLDITLNFSGTGPFTYCYKFCLEGVDKECGECSLSDETIDSNHVNIVYYLHRVGNYTLMFIVDNVASRQVKSYLVKITDTVRNQPVPFVPIVCSISAALILLTGVTLHLKFKKIVFTETADFDFTRHAYEEEEIWEDEEQSFVQRVKYLLFSADRDNHNSMIDSDISGSRARLF